ncbi:MAG: hypothetical protein UV53_C0008G0008 [Candidatus Azambacteria bacterium GW2011_GWE1_42_9]|nr:MAG: hypothetical protein UU33_C0001G0239 [Candidatus Azambacteria bacterium GW2011_GWF1_41_10]KKS49272.1 MAG: hypothetical protein UV14_C0001G0017 [Candidatus Azambacteria bacterium GW2011_GWF2_42_22]KKS74218.1 MAG: hypothetical protein UV45_C0009G0004 [Candidatus Azambacteria bacterium GW2011_GWB1_42_72]KKS79375.1 MAG: hypothetical protein UV53_C0008G0008 [Candidatus Azambacteria bacterium GW2011_GWE1_42_9]KKT03148.1 MAG: hypothetical protein UV81_C0003G0015 [Candidatus Azambacteria bacter
MARYFFRLDDIAPNMNWNNFNRLVLIFDKYGIKPLLGAIPDNQDEELLKYPNFPDFWQVANNLKNKGYIIAQHGYQHLYKTQDGGILRINKKGEFSGLGFEIQKQMINSGKDIVKEKICEPKIFIAPAHSFDRNTIGALKINSFDFISDGIALYPFKKWGIIWLPQILWRPRKGLFGKVTIALHPNTMTGQDFDDLEKFINENRNKIGNFSELMGWYAQSGSIKRTITFFINQAFKVVWWPIFWTKFRILK